MTSAASNRFLLLAAALLFSTGGAAIKALSLSSWQVASFRSAVAAVALYLFFRPDVRKIFDWRIAAVGIAYAGTLVLFVLANKLTTSANSIFLQSTAPLYLLLLGPVLLREHIRRTDLLLILMVASGMSLFFIEREAAVATAPDPFTGNILASASGVTWAFTLLGLRWLGSRKQGGNEGIVTVIAGNAAACLICLPFALPVAEVTPSDAGILLYLGVFQIGLAYVCMTRALRQVRAFEASLLLLAEPALNPIWTLLVHGERPGSWAAMGGAVILGASLLNTWLQTRAGASAESRT